MTLTVDLPDYAEAFVRDQVDNIEGIGFRSVNEVMTAAVHDHMLMAGGNVYSAAIERLVMEGLADVEAGRLLGIDEVFGPLLAKLERMAEEQESPAVVKHA